MSDRTGLEIAVIGLAGRFPGAAGVEAFWKNLCGGVESISFFSPEELIAAGLDRATVEHPNFVRARGALDGAELFDAGLFELSPREAEILDPQHRLFLECAWEALENAGYDPLQFDDLIGIYAGAGPNTYLIQLLSRPDLLATMGNFQLTLASEKDYLATRTSFKLGLSGPSIVVQTACSTSLVAIHVGCQSLLAGECRMALAGGVRVVAMERSGYFFREGGIDSPDGHCRAFDARARGTVSGSGAGVLVLKRLEDALADGDRICAVVKGSAVNNDGSSKVGYTAPSVDGQVAVIRMAQSIAEVAPETVGYVETHGTGTELGDPVEIAALTKSFGLSVHGTCAIGSVKTNIGHLDAAAGVAGFIKAALAVERGLIPPSLHFERSNPELGIEATPFYVNTSLRKWESEGPRRAGVSSFGIGGTNAHVVVEQPPEQAPTGPGRPWQLLVLSARTASALERRTRDLAAHLRAHPGESLADVAFTCHLGRRRLGHRRIVVCRDAAEAAAALGSGDPRVLSRVQEAVDRPVAFLFPGQGAQYVEMARGLYQGEPVFAGCLDRCAEILELHLGLDLRRVLYPSPAERAEASRALERTALTQPAIFAVEYSLARLWMSWGVRPWAMLGHSIGEFVAACLAETLTLEDTLALVATRGRLMQELPEGAMLAVPLDEREIAPLLADGLSLAAINGPGRCVVAGPGDGVERLQRVLADRGVESRRLHTSHAFHSAMMEPAVEPFRERVRTVSLSPPRIPYLSTLTGSWTSAEQATDPESWARHLREPVRFGEALATLLESPDVVLLEVGPGRALATLVRSHPAWEHSRDLVGSLSHPDERADDAEFILTALGRLWLAGAPVDAAAFYGGQRRRRLALPTYPFERERYWVDPAAKSDSRLAPTLAASLGAAAADEPPPPMRARAHARPDLETAYVAPRTPLEETLAGIWQALLGIRSIGAHDNFFELGGHSLLMTQVVAHVERSLGVGVALRTLFAVPTVAGQAEVVERSRSSSRAGGEPSVLLPTVQPDAERLYESFPLTDVQRAYWVGRTDALELGNVATHTYTEIDVVGLALERLERALQRVIDRQHMLRAIVLPDGRQQILASVSPYWIEVLDLTGSAVERSRDALSSIRERMSHQVLPSDRWPLFEVRASRLDGGKIRLHFSFDFLLGDAWSFRVLFSELARFYVEPEAELAPLELSFRDYVLAEQALAGSELHRRSLEYWRSRLASLPPGPELPLARHPAQIRRPRFVRRAHRLDAAGWASLKARAARFGLTPSGALLAAFAEALARWSKSPRFTLTLTLFRRLPMHPQVDQLIGDFTSLTLLEVDCSGDEPFVSRARRLQGRLFEDLDHRYVSGVQVLRELAVLRGQGQGGTMPVVFTSLLGLAARGDESAAPPDELARLEGEVIYSISQTPQVWLDHQVAEVDGELSCNWDVVEELFPEGLVEDLFVAYCRLVERLVQGEEAWSEPSPLPLVAAPTASDALDFPPPCATLHGLFLAQVGERPGRTAVVSRGRAITYAELDGISAALATRLRRLGARPGRMVAVVMEKGWEQVAAVLGVLRCGAAYLPVDSALPRERRWQLMEQGGAEVALTQPWLEESLDWPEWVKRVGVTGDQDASEDGEPAACAVSPENLAYVIFTSGSTGLPKGVMIDHRGAVNTILDVNRRFGVGPEDRVLAVSSLSFDLSVYDVFGLLAAGGTVVMADASPAPDPEGWLELMAREQVTIWNSVPALMEILVEGPGAAAGGLPGSLRLVLLSGDWIPLALPARIAGLATRASVVSLGGATEASIWSILHPIDGVDPAWKSIPYGRAMVNQSVQVLDGRLDPRPAGVPGELYIGGIGVAQGYWRDEERTGASFVTHPRTGERLYRTGDLGRYLPNGEIEFLGREDHQVKIGGHRIELGEIEAALDQHPAVQSCVVTAHGPDRERRRLVAYVVLDQARAVGDADELEGFLGSKLPGYMVPAVFVALDALPLTPNGKVDRRALPSPDLPQSTSSAAPPSPAEATIAGIWADVLGLAQVGVQEDFFALGGDSLQATRVAARVRAAFGVELSLRQFFEAPTVAALAARLETAGRLPSALRPPPIARAPRHDRMPLSFGQERLWFLDQLEPGNAAYSMPGAVLLSGRLDRAALAASLAEVVRRHEVLRTTFPFAGEGPVQEISPPSQYGLPLPLVDLSGLPASARERAARRIAREEAARPFDLRRGPLVRTRLLRLAPEDHALLWNTHHIVSDGWSVGVIFVRELAALYAAFAQGLPSPLAEPPIQYADYAVWQRDWLAGETLEGLLGYWRERLAGAPAGLVLPADRPRPAVLSSLGGYRSFHLPQGTVGSLGELARSQRATPFMALVAGFAALLQRYSGEADVLIGTPTANRDHLEVEDLIGFFANTLVLRLDLSGAPSFRELIARSREVALGAFAHQDMPFEKLVEALQPERSLARTPLFQVMFVLQNAVAGPLELPGLTLAPLPLEMATSKLDLTLDLVETADEIFGTFEFSADVFDPATVDRMAGHLARLLAGASADPDRQVSRLPLLTESEQRQLAEWNDTSRDNGPEVWIHELFAACAAADPEAVALVYEGEELSYGALNRRANHLAHRLMTLGVGPDVAVGVCAERSPELVAALLAVLKAGGAYLPLDPEYPRERLALMMEDSQVPVLLAQERLLDRLPPHRGRLVPLDAAAAEAIDAPPRRVGGANLAYVLYTSGSTGRPKGVMVPHLGIRNRLLWMQEAYELTAADRVVQKTPFSFDVSVWEFFWPLLCGARLVVARPGGHRDSSYLAELIQATGATVVHFVPSMLRAFVDEPRAARCGSLRLIVCSGEALPSDLRDRALALFPNAELHNLYGPTEAAVDVTAWACDRTSDLSVVPIGRPIANTAVYVLDPDCGPQPVGVPGELCLGGVQLARGYLARPDLTAERFAPDPFDLAGQGPGARLYRTGDLVRWLPDGTLEFLGRLDQQVKVRGFRIEPGEIEAILLQHAAVREVVVVARCAEGDTRLAAYLVAAGALSIVELRGFVAARVPDFMVPSWFVQLAALPYTASGKLDRKALPAPEAAALPRAQYVAPRNGVEEVVAATWAAILALGRVGVSDDFFALGGHSLAASRVAAQLREVFEVEVPLRRFFEAPTVEAIAAEVTALLAAGQRAPTPPIGRQPRDRPLPLSFAQERLWFLHLLQPASAAYSIPVAVRLRGALVTRALAAALGEVVRRHEVLRSTYGFSEAGPVQRIGPAREWAAPEVDLAALPPSRREEELRRLTVAEAARPFNLSAEPPLRARLVRLADEDHALLLNLHHIAADGWSMEVLVGEVGALYATAIGGYPSPLPELPIQYGDFACWQRSWLSGEELERQLGYWRAQLSGAPSALDLGTDRPRPPVQTFRGAQRSRELSAPFSAELRTFGLRERATPFMVLLATFGALLSRRARQEELVVGVPVANRPRAELERLIGFFVNTLALRLDVAGDPSFRKLLGRVRRTVLDAYAHQGLPFERLIQELHVERALDRSPLFQVMLVLQNAPAARLEVPALSASLLEAENRTAKFELTLSVAEGGRGFALLAEYNTDLFDGTTIDRLLADFERLLRAAATSPTLGLDDLPWLDEAERHQLLREWNDTATAGPRGEGWLHRLIAEQCAASPGAPAVECCGEWLSYGELDDRARRLARALRRSGVWPEAIVAVDMGRCLDLVPTLLGILKAGGAYLPLDPSWPVARRSFILAEAGARVVIRGDTASALLTSDGPVAGPGEALGGEEPADSVTGESLAYVLYTSGSTGAPKGVMVTHRGLIHYLGWCVRAYDLGPGGLVPVHSPVGFDLTVTGLFAPLLVGGMVSLLPEGEEWTALTTTLTREPRLALLKVTPAHLGMLNALVPAEDVAGKLGVLVVGGEALEGEVVSPWLSGMRGARVVNEYGPTETVVSCVYELPRKALSGPVPIGRPVAETRLYVLTPQRAPAPLGVVGELFIAGAGLARGYLARPDLTAERFLPDPFAQAPGERMYHTGDLARYRVDGELEFVGRADHQIKIRGYGIELGETEAALEQHPRVSQALVQAREDLPGDRRLVAYVEIAAIWREVLRVEQVGLHENFFDLGGHSLSLVEVRRRLMELVGHDISMTEMFRYPTVASLAGFLAADGAPAMRQPEVERAAGSAERLEDPAIAVVGMSGRFPGASSVRQFWQNLRRGVESISFFSAEELRSAGIPAGLLANPNYVRARGILEEADAFDARFFGYSPREAELIDPQHRVFLECAWEALESAGYEPATYPGRIGVLAGVSASTYWLHLLSHPEVAVSVDQAVIANDKDFLPTRVSYKLGLRGPSISVQTACSTSLVAVHLACRCLRVGEADMVLAGGASVRSAQRSGYLYQEGGILSADGHCRAFDAHASGTLPGDGVGIVLLKRLQDALAAGDEIHAVILGSAINNDGGHKIGFTAPSVEGQSEVIRAALAEAGVGPETISYVEAHGTATALGDPVEAAALLAAYGRAEESGCALGSVKTNIGHLDAAAGIAGLIKTVLALENRLIPPSLHFTRPNPEIDFSGRFHVNTELAPWPAAADRPRRAGVSSFGMGGTNVHLILEEAPPVAPSGPCRAWQLLVLSARSPEALAAATANLHAFLAGNEEYELADLAHTLQVGRRAFEHRRAVICRDRGDAARALEALDPERVATGDGEPRRRKVCFLFPGQGSQHPGMGRELYAAEAGFRRHVDLCAKLLLPRLGLDLRSLFDPGRARDDLGPLEIDETWLAQPVLFVCEYALSRLWMEWGVRPAAMAGHSIGEYVAACLGGVFSLEEALDLVALRGRLMQSLPRGRMVGIALPEEEIRSLLGERLSVAAVNGPSLCVVSGPADAVGELEERLSAAGVHCRALATSHAFHSRMMEPILQPFGDRLRRIGLQPPEIPFLSNLTGTWIRPQEATDPNYWTQHLRHTVRFAENLRELLRDPESTLLEVGPGKILSTLAGRHPDRDAGAAIVTSLPGAGSVHGDGADLLAALGKLWIAGVEIRWPAVCAHERRRRIAAPTYPFQRQRYWISAQPPQLASEPRPRTNPAEWLYLPCWKKTVPPRPREDGAPHSPWLVFCDTRGVGALVIERLRAAGATVVQVVAGERFERREDCAFAVAPGDPAGYRALLAELRSRDLLPRSVVHLWSVTSAGAPTRASCEAVQELGFFSLLFLAQALGEQMPGERVRLAVVSSGMQPVTGEEAIDPGKATLLGPCRTIPQEFPAIACRSIDVVVEPPSHPDALGRQLVDELMSDAEESVVAYRGKHRWVEAFEPVEAAPPATRQELVRPGGTYFITGGLGGMALALADHLASVYGARLVLVARTRLPERDRWDEWVATHGEVDRTSRRILRLRELEKYEGKVLVLTADVADPDQMRQSVAEARRRFGPIHGVIHAAGAPPSGLMQWKTRESAVAVLAPKVAGTWVLDEIFGDELDFMLLCSSISSVLGQVGRVDYCAANGFLDAFAHYRFGTGKTHVVSVCWDTWRDAGMAFDEALRRGQDPRRVISVGMSASDGAEVMRLALAARTPQLVVSIEDFRAAAERLQQQAALPAAGQARVTAMRAHPRPSLSSPYETPGNHAERAVASIWEGVFGIAGIGVHDDFFELGGDSVLSLQILARLHEAGLRLTPRQVFELRTVAEMAAAADGRSAAPAEEPGPAAGDVPLTPIQRWFFERNPADPHHFNQSMLAVVQRPLAAAVLERAVEALLLHHDALRLRFAPDGPTGWRQWTEAPGGASPVACVSLSELPAAARGKATERAAAELQASLDLARGPLLRVVSFDFGSDSPGRLLIIVHHLVIDAVSWRILLADLETAYRQLERGERASLPAKTTSFQRWARRLQEYAEGADVGQSLAYWADERRRHAGGLTTDLPGGANTVSSARSVSVTLDTAATRILLHELPRVRRVNVQEVLLTALALAFHGWSDSGILIDLEGHGREPIFDDVDLSRTVGWFTALSPALVRLETTAPLAALASVKEQLREMPGPGLSHALLRYLSPRGREDLAGLPAPQVSFLYLGQLDAAGTGASIFAAAPESRGAEGSPRALRSHLLEIIASITGGELRMAWIYSENLHRRATIERLAETCLVVLRDLVLQCEHNAEPGYSPADFPHAGLTRDGLNDLLAELQQSAE